MTSAGSLRSEAGRLRRWADSLPESERSGDWEAAYPAWQALWRAAETALQQPELAEEDIDDLLYVLARDREEQWVLEHLREPDSPHTLTLARAALGYPDKDTRWQLVDVLAGWSGDEAEELLQAFTKDGDQFVRRRAIPAVAKFYASLAEKLALEEIASHDPYSRLMAFRVLVDINSEQLPAATAALRDDRDALVRTTVRSLGGEG